MFEILITSHLFAIFSMCYKNYMTDIESHNASNFLSYTNNHRSHKSLTHSELATYSPGCGSYFPIRAQNSWINQWEGLIGGNWPITALETVRLNTLLLHRPHLVIISYQSAIATHNMPLSDKRSSLRQQQLYFAISKNLKVEWST